MRTIVAVIGTLAAVTLALAGCSSDDGDAVEIAGAQKNCVAGPTDTGFVANCVLALSDERVSGRNDVEFIEIEGTSPVEFVGTSVITNDDGYWAGGCTGTIDEDTDLQSFDCVYVGAGGYAGMTYDAHMEGTDYPNHATGVLTTG